MKPENIKQCLKDVKAFISSGDEAAALSAIRNAATPEMDYLSLYKFSQLYKKLGGCSVQGRPIRIAIVASSTPDHFVDILKLFLGLDGFAPEIFLPEFGTVPQALLNPGSDVYSFRPDLIWIFTNYRDLEMDIAHGCGLDDVCDGVESCVASFSMLWDAVRKNCGALILQNNADVPAVRIFGNYEGSAAWSRINSMRSFNLQLAQKAPSGVSIFDMDYLSSLYGKRSWHDERMWYHSKHSFSLDASGLVAFSAARLVKGIKGQAKKCIVLDLDNTLWGGIIGDDGLNGIVLGAGADGEAFKDFQKYILELKKRGVVLCVCSKNEEANARIPFELHPDMCIKYDDIAVFVANWNNKADNIKQIAATLDIGLDSIVFVDDNPAERELVKQMLPMVAVPDMPEDPAKYIRAIDRECYFETTVFSEEDKKRSEMYRGNAQRKQVQAQCVDLEAFLTELRMEAVASDFDAMHVPRISQLINKSNQFHLTTTRYTEAEVGAMSANADYSCRYFKMKDRFGDNGLISLYILKQEEAGSLVVDTFVMSCRVLSRGMEEFVYNDMVATARRLGAVRLVGVYKPTAKNGLVAKLYDKLGFDLVGEADGVKSYQVVISDDTPLKKHFITAVEAY